MSYYADSGWEVRYAAHDGAAWHAQVVATLWDASGWTALALDAAGLPRLAYFDSDPGAIGYVAYDGQQWTTEVVDRAVG